jgi:hypothetical protein
MPVPSGGLGNASTSTYILIRGYFCCLALAGWDKREGQRNPGRSTGRTAREAKKVREAGTARGTGKAEEAGSQPASQESAVVEGGGLPGDR